MLTILFGFSYDIKYLIRRQKDTVLLFSCLERECLTRMGSDHIMINEVNICFSILIVSRILYFNWRSYGKDVKLLVLKKTNVYLINHYILYFIYVNSWLMNKNNILEYIECYAYLGKQVLIALFWQTLVRALDMFWPF